MTNPTEYPIIQTLNLVRTFKKTRAVDGLNLSLIQGELFGLVGPDGAGKTTTLRLLAGLLDISEGEALILDYDLKTDAESAKQHIGYMAQQFSLYAELSVLENLRFFAELFDVPQPKIEEQTNRLLTFAGLTEFKDRRAANLSGGMQKKLALACTLIHQPEILLLDEPTTGVDPISRREFWNILTELHIQGTTILVSTPYMDEADRCSKIGLMYEGKLIECDTPANIKAILGHEVIELHPEDWKATIELVKQIKGVREVQTYGESLHLLVDSAEQRLPKIEKTLRKAGLKYYSIRQVPARMEEAFISLIRRMEK